MKDALLFRSKIYLQSYKQEDYQALNVDGITYLLTCLKVGWFGKKKEVVMTYTIPYYTNSKKYFDRWDELIKTQKPLK